MQAAVQQGRRAARVSRVCVKKSWKIVREMEEVDVRERGQRFRGQGAELVVKALPAPPCRLNAVKWPMTAAVGKEHNPHRVVHLVNPLDIRPKTCTAPHVQCQVFSQTAL